MGTCGAEVFRFALAINSHSIVGLRGKAEALLKLGLKEDALRYFREAVTIAPADAALWTDPATCLSILNKGAEALSACKRAVKFDPNMRKAWKTIGNIAGEMGDTEGALGAYNHVGD